MNLEKFDRLMSASGGRLGQEPEEWRLLLEFADAYFKARGVGALFAPVVVEIGVMHNAQKPFWTELLGADHIGIDIAGGADIIGDSRSPATVAALKAHLAGRPIDLLFIDGDHLYHAVKADFENYGPLTRHIIALHDISHVWNPAIPEETMRFWKEVVVSDCANAHIAIERHNAATTGITAGRQMGIGLVIKPDEGR